MKTKFKYLLVVCLAVCMAVSITVLSACDGEAKRLSDTFTVTFVLEDQPDAVISDLATKFKASFFEGDTEIGGAGSGTRTDENNVTHKDVSSMEGTIVTVVLKTLPTGYAYVDADGNAYNADNHEGETFDLSKVSEATITLKKVSE